MLDSVWLSLVGLSQVRLGKGRLSEVGLGLGYVSLKVGYVMLRYARLGYLLLVMLRLLKLVQV